MGSKTKKRLPSAPNGHSCPVLLALQRELVAPSPFGPPCIRICVWLTPVTLSWLFVQRIYTASERLMKLSCADNNESRSYLLAPRSSSRPSTNSKRISEIKATQKD